MNTFLRIAWRNIWRNRRRTLIIIAAVAFSVAISTFSIALGDGSHDAVIRNALSLHTGSFQIQRKGYLEDPSVELVFPYDEKITGPLNSTSGITAYAPRIQTGALAGNAENSVGCLVTGIDPEREVKVTLMHRKIIKGSFLKNDKEGECVIGEKMAKNLDCDTGSQLAILTRGIDGSTGASRFTVSGIFKTGSDDADRTMMFITLKDAQSLLMADGMVHSVAASVDSPDRTDRIIQSLQDKIKNPEITVQGWRRLLPGLVQFLQLDDIFNWIFIGLIMLVVVFGVLSALVAAVLERIREFGLMLALGTKPFHIVVTVMAESFILTFMGLALGLAVGLALSYHTVLHPINLSAQYESILARYGMENKLYAAIYPLRITAVAAFIILLSMIFSLYPAVKASMLKPDHALRCEK